MTRTTALLARLALPAGHRHRRTLLAEDLWPDTDSDAARHRLRQALVGVRRLIHRSDALRTEHECVYLHAECIEIDVAHFLAAVRAAESALRARWPEERLANLVRAIDLYAGDLLPALVDPWIEDERHRLRQVFLDSLRSLALCAEAAGDYPGAVAAARRLTAEEPTDEDATLLLIRLLKVGGHSDGARREYERFRKAARRAGLRQSDAYRRKIRELTGGPKPPAPSPAGAPAIVERPPLLRTLPVFLTRFFGREPEMDHLQRLLADPRVRLVTVVGPGGLGKTRLSVEVAAGSKRSICFVGFASIPVATSTDAIAALVAAALGLPALEGANRAKPLDAVVAALRLRGTLILIMDNLEHLLESGAPHELVHRLLQDTPHLTILATSRLPLGIDGEMTFPLSTLPTVNEGTDTAVAYADANLPIDAAPGVALFVDRVQSLRPDFEITTGNVVTIETLCRRLDGLPLALELAAGWARTLSLEQMLKRLDQRFTFLVRRDARDGASNAVIMSVDGAPAERHRSLAAVVGWSYDMLPASTAAFFRRLAVFRGGWTTAAAAAVASVELDVADEHMEVLCEHNLVVAGALAGGPARFDFLETLRDFAADQLSVDERTDAERNHLAYYSRLAGDGEIGLKGPEQWNWLDRLAADLPNFGAALERTGSYHEADVARAELVLGLNEFWWNSDLFAGSRWTETTLKFADLPVPIRAALLAWYGRFQGRFGNVAVSDSAQAEAVQLFRDVNDAAGVAGTLSRWVSNPEALREAIVLCSGNSQNWELAHAYRHCAHHAASRAETAAQFATAQALITECRDSMHLMGFRSDEAAFRARWGEIDHACVIAENVIEFDSTKRGNATGSPTIETASCQLLLADLRRLQGELDTSRTLLLRLENYAKARGLAGYTADALVNLALVYMDSYELRSAGACIEERKNLLSSLPTSKRRAVVGNTLLAKLALLEGDTHLAARHAGAAVRDGADAPQKCWQARARIALGQAALRIGDVPAAASAFHTAVLSASNNDNRIVTAEAVEACAHAIGASGRLADAAFFLAFAAAERDAMGIILPPFLRSEHDTAYAAVRGALSARVLFAAGTRGSRATIASVLRLLDRAVPVTSP